VVAEIQKIVAELRDRQIGMITDQCPGNLAITDRAYIMRGLILASGSAHTITLLCGSTTWVTV